MDPQMNNIERQAKKFADAREALSGIVGEMNEAIEAIKRSNMKRLKKAVAETAEQHDKLQALIADAPARFVKPRSVTMHGIKFGYQKGKGKIEWKDDDQVVKLIRKHFPESADLLIISTEKPAKEPLSKLSAVELKKIAVSVVDGGDTVFIKPADSAVDKLVDALLKSATEEVE